MNRTTLFEFESTTLPLELSNLQWKCLAKLQYESKRILEIQGKYVKATSFVGIIQLPGLAIEILPKLYRNDASKTEEATKNLLHLLQYTKKLFRKIKESDLSNLSKRKTNFFEVLIYLFALHLSELLKLGVHRIYRRLDEESYFLRGSWRISEQIAKGVMTTPHFAITYDEHTENNPLNCVLKFVTKQLLHITQDTQNKKLLNKILLILPEVDDLQVVSAADLLSIHFNRLNEQYRPIFELAKLFLAGLSIQLSASQTRTYAFVFDMNILFEEFVAEFLKQQAVLKGTRYEDCIIKTQSGTKYLASHGYQQLFHQRPDIRLEKDGHTWCIIDTKYKLLSAENRQWGVSEGDAGQMYVYSRRYDCKRTILLYPEHSAITKTVVPIETFDGRWIEVHTIDLSRDISKPVNRDLMKLELREILQSNLR